jgi:hypothetical protein
LQTRTARVIRYVRDLANSDHFVVDRSPDGRTFAAVQNVAAAGTSTTPRIYISLDAQAGPFGVTPVYFRLRSVDADGTSAYSFIHSVALSPAATGLALFPKLTTQATTMTGAPAGTPIQVLAALGRTVSTAITDAGASGVAELRLLGGLASGVYVVCAGSQALRLMVN